MTTGKVTVAEVAKIKDLYGGSSDRTGKIKYKKNGIIIQKAHLSALPFELEDEFTVDKHTKTTLTLKRV